MYVTQSPDTSEEAERVQFNILRAMGKQRRWTQGLSMVDQGYRSQWQALERLHPGWTREQLLIEWVRIQYGEELSSHYTNYLYARTSE